MAVTVASAGLEPGPESLLARPNSRLEARLLSSPSTMFAAWRRPADGMIGNPERVCARQTRALQESRAGSIEA